MPEEVQPLIWYPKYGRGKVLSGKVTRVGGLPEKRIKKGSFGKQGWKKKVAVNLLSRMP